MNQIGGDHYERCSIQPWEVIRRNGLDYWEGNIVKYLFRHKQKGGLQDLLKAQHYLTYIIEHYENLHPESQERQLPRSSGEAPQ